MSDAPVDLPGHGSPAFSGIVLSQILGQGGMGVVYKGLHTRLCIPVAVKVVSGGLASLNDGFMNEARLAAKINHPNVARVYDVNIEGGVAYIVQEFVEGESVADLIDRTREKKTWLEEARALEIAADAVRGLAAIHREGIVHLDIKPENILIQARDGVAKIVDLGLARRIKQPLPHDEDPRRPSLSIYGTPGYMSPEQIQGLSNGPETDIYALGATLYEMLTNQQAFPGDASNLLSIFNLQIQGEPPDPRRVRGDLSAATASIVRKCLQSDTAERFAVSAALLECLADARARLNKQPASGAPEPADFLSAAPPSSVVCVDDDPAIRELVKDTLSAAGHSVQDFPDGATALGHLAAHTADLVLLDMEMPGASGLKVCRAVRAIPSCHEVPIVFMSAIGELSVIDMAMDLGATDYLVKPVSPGDLMARVACLTRLHRIQRERAALEAAYNALSSRKRKRGRQ